MTNWSTVTSSSPSDNHDVNKFQGINRWMTSVTGLMKTAGRPFLVTRSSILCTFSMQNNSHGPFISNGTRLLHEYNISLILSLGCCHLWCSRCYLFQNWLAKTWTYFQCDLYISFLLTFSKGPTSKWVFTSSRVYGDSTNGCDGSVETETIGPLFMIAQTSDINVSALSLARYRGALRPALSTSALPSKLFFFEQASYWEGEHVLDTY